MLRDSSVFAVGHPNWKCTAPGGTVQGLPKPDKSLSQLKLIRTDGTFPPSRTFLAQWPYAIIAATVTSGSSGRPCPVGPLRHGIRRKRVARDHLILRVSSHCRLRSARRKWRHHVRRHIVNFFASAANATSPRYPTIVSLMSCRLVSVPWSNRSRRQIRHCQQRETG